MSAPELASPAVAKAAALFATEGELEAIEPHGSGHINDTFLVTYRTASGERRYIQQCLNQKIFPEPAKLMSNIAHVTAHLRSRLGASRDESGWQVLTLVETRAGQTHGFDEHGACWRMSHYVAGTCTEQFVSEPSQAFEVARAFGTFQRLLFDYAGPALHETLPNFHDSEKRLEQLDAAVRQAGQARLRQAQSELACVDARRDLASALLTQARSGAMRQRITHNDAKLSNVLLDPNSGQGLCVLDLDTVMPGLPLYDFGDLVRTAAVQAPEDERDLSRVTVSVPLFAALARGYLTGLRGQLSALERNSLLLAGQVITFTMGLRFLTDYLAGDRYYKIQRPGHNLDRARCQFALLRSLETNAAELVFNAPELG